MIYVNFFIEVNNNYDKESFRVYDKMGFVFV